MDHAKALDDLLGTMVTEYVVHNRAAGILKTMLDDCGIGFTPVIDHVTIRTFDIDHGAEPFIHLAMP